MEEILSSIRKIISDDDQSADEPLATEAAVAVPDPEPEPEPVPDPQPEEFAEQVEAVPEVTEPIEVAAIEPIETAVEPVEEDPNEDIFELTDVVEEDSLAELPEAAPMDLIDPDTVDDLEFAPMPSEPELVVEEEPPVVAPVEPEPPAAVEPPTMEAPAEAPASANSDDALLSDRAGSSTSASFGKLAETMLLNYGDAKTIEELVQEMLRPMLKMWLDENLPPLVERLVREEIERVARRR